MKPSGQVTRHSPWCRNACSRHSVQTGSASVLHVWHRFCSRTQPTSAVVVVVVVAVVVVVEAVEVVVVTTGSAQTSHSSHCLSGSVVKHQGRASPSGLRQNAPSARPAVGLRAGVREWECGVCVDQSWHVRPLTVMPTVPR